MAVPAATRSSDAFADALREALEHPEPTPAPGLLSRVKSIFKR